MKTAEAVTPRHPDKLCDRISDAILDACLKQDPMSRVAVETMGGHGIITITGELTTKAYINIREIAQGIAGNQYGVQVNIVQQSSEIARGVDAEGAGDQGIMVGYACNDNKEMIPQELFLARSLCKFLFAMYPYDGKTQITLNDENQIETIIASFQNTTSKELKEAIFTWYAFLGLEEEDIIKFSVLANPAGDWVQGGFEADTGLTGRKLIVDNYGPQVAIGGGCFSGKDATKVDRSGAYMARKIAVDYIKKNPTEKDVTVKIAYAIGVIQPVMATVQISGESSDMSGHDRIINIDLLKENNYDLTPQGIIKFLKLREPQFEKTAQFGHFGEGFTWDK